MSTSNKRRSVHQELVTADVVACGRPVIILERIDGTQLGASRKWIHKVAGVLKGYSLEDPLFHNRYRGRVLTHRLARAGIAAHESGAIPGEPSPQLSEADLAKIHVFYGFGAYQKHEPLWDKQIDFRIRRPTAVHFAGTVEYRGSEIETHRRLAVEMVAKLGGTGGAGRPLPKGEYLASMLESRTVLCPFGWGEASHRDYEAMLLGCVVIKPNMSFVASWPEMFIPFETYIPCRPDWSDVPDLVDRVTRDWPEFRRSRMLARRLAVDAGRPHKIALRLQELLGRLL